MPTPITIVPSPRKMMQSLRDVGYDLHTAIADVVDNSVVSQATEVSVNIEYAGAGSWIRIADNGQGMTAEELDEALRYGADRMYATEDLGKFGLGLKLASFSQCQRLTVASRTDTSDIEIRCWDLNHVIAVDEWQLLKLAPEECPRHALAPLQKRAGTVVFWEQLDRVLDKLPAAPEKGQVAMNKLCGEVQEHLAMVFHRFLDGTAKRPYLLKIFVNGNTTEPWDPFLQANSKTQALEEKTLGFVHDSNPCVVHVQPYVLPHKEQLSAQAFRDAAGPNKWNRQQGFYIYRNDRMIQSGGWNRLRTLDEHTKLARIALDFSSVADTAFKINVSKMNVTIPGAIRDDLERIADQVAQAANRAYRKERAEPSVSYVTPTAKLPNSTTTTSSKPTWANPSTQEQPTPSITVSTTTPPASSSVQASLGTFKPPIGTAPTSYSDSAQETSPSPVSISEPQPSATSGATPAYVKDVVAVLTQKLAYDRATLVGVLRALAEIRPEFCPALKEVE